MLEEDVQLAHPVAHCTWRKHGFGWKLAVSKGLKLGQTSQMWCSCAGPRTGARRAPSRREVQSWESCHDVSETTPRSRSQVRAYELQNRQWATPVDLGISSQIVICLLFACDYLRYIVLHLCRTQIMENIPNNIFS